MTEQEFKAILNNLPGVDVFHNEASEAGNNYIVWRKVGKNRLNANNQTAESAGRYAVDFFTKDEYSEIPERLEMLLAAHDISVTDEAIDFEAETGFTHYAYTVEV